MRVAPEQLTDALRRSLAPVYLLSGDEPLQLNEAADSIRQRARQQGFSEREVLEADTGFDWARLAAEANSLSLFASQRMIDLRVPSGKPGTNGGKALTEYASNPPPDTLLLLSMPKLERAQTASKWLKAIDRVGVVVQIWPIEGQRLQPWVEQRMRAAGLRPGAQVAAMLAERIEGNLLAAKQEIEKLLLLYGPGEIGPEQLAKSVADSARYDVFGLVDSAHAGKLTRCIRMLDGLRAEGTPAPVVLWALARELRLLVSLANDIERGQPVNQALSARRDLWEKRKPLVRQGLQRLDLAGWRQLLLLCGQADQAIKGRDPSDPWRLLREILTRMAGGPALH